MNNLVSIIGRLTKDPELQTSENDKSYSNITLAIQRSYKNSEGIYDTDFINTTLWEDQAKNACEHCHKGDILAIRGRLENYKDKEDNTRLKLVPEKIAFLGRTNIDKNKDDMER